MVVVFRAPPANSASGTFRSLDVNQNNSHAIAHDHPHDRRTALPDLRAYSDGAIRENQPCAHVEDASRVQYAWKPSSRAVSVFEISFEIRGNQVVSRIPQSLGDRQEAMGSSGE